MTTFYVPPPTTQLPGGVTLEERRVAVCGYAAARMAKDSLQQDQAAGVDLSSVKRDVDPKTAQDVYNRIAAGNFDQGTIDKLSTQDKAALMWCGQGILKMYVEKARSWTASYGTAVGSATKGPLSDAQVAEADRNALGTLQAKWANSPQTFNAFVSACNRWAIHPSLAYAVVKTESGFDQHAVSSTNAQGYMQVEPATAAGMGYNPNLLQTDPATNFNAGCQYLRQMVNMFKGNEETALWAYNEGPGAAQNGRADYAYSAVVYSNIPLNGLQQTQAVR